MNAAAADSERGPRTLGKQRSSRHFCCLLQGEGTRPLPSLGPSLPSSLFRCEGQSSDLEFASPFRGLTLGVRVTLAPKSLEFASPFSGIAQDTNRMDSLV